MNREPTGRPRSAGRWDRSEAQLQTELQIASPGGSSIQCKSALFASIRSMRQWVISGSSSSLNSRRHPETATRSRRFRCIIGLQSHSIRLMESWKLNCAWALQRKTLNSLPVALSGTLSPVRFQGGNRTIAAISRNFDGNAVEFLCNPDCVAESEGFEPSVPVLASTTV